VILSLVSTDSVRRGNRSYRRLWAFLKSDAQAQLSVRKAHAHKGEKSGAYKSELLFPGSNARRILDEELQVAIPALDAQVESCQERCQEMQEALRTNEVRLLPPLINFDLTDLKRLVNIRHDEVEQLGKIGHGATFGQSREALRELKHRQILGNDSLKLSRTWKEGNGQLKHSRRWEPLGRSR